MNAATNELLSRVILHCHANAVTTLWKRNDTVEIHLYQDWSEYTVIVPVWKLERFMNVVREYAPTLWDDIRRMFVYQPDIGVVGDAQWWGNVDCELFVAHFNLNAYWVGWAD